MDGQYIAYVGWAAVVPIKSLSRLQQVDDNVTLADITIRNHIYVDRFRGGEFVYEYLGGGQEAADKLKEI